MVHIRLDRTMLVEDAIDHIVKVLGYDPWGSKVPKRERALNYIGFRKIPKKFLK